MSLQALRALTDAILTVNKLTPDSSTLGKATRKISKLNRHVVYVSKNELEHELADLIYRSLGYDSSAGEYNYETAVANDPTVESYVFKNQELKKLTNIVYNNLNNAFGKLKDRFGDQITISPYLDGFKVDIFTKQNNYDLIGQAFSKVWEGEGQYGNLKLFIQNTLGNTSEMYKAVQDSTEHGKSGFDRGHGQSASHDISNIENLINVVGINSIKNLYNKSDLSKLTEQQIDVIEKDIRETFGNPVAVDQMWQTLRRSGAIDSRLDNFEDLLDTYVDVTVSLFRQVANGEIQLSLVTEQKITNITQLEGLIRELDIAIRPQSALGNQASGGNVQSKLADLLSKKNAAVFKNINAWLSGKQVSAGSGRNKRSFPPEPLVLPGSDTIKKMMDDSIYEILTTGKSAKKTARSSFSKTSTPQKVKVKKLYEIDDVAEFLKKKPVVAPKIIRKKRADSLNIINVVNMINMQLSETIRDNMGTPKLNYRTGRFAKSAQVLPGRVDKDGYLRLPYTYMKYPYQTFEVGYAKGTPSRDPRKVISESIRELAIRLVLMKMRVVRV